MKEEDDAGRMIYYPGGLDLEQLFTHFFISRSTIYSHRIHYSPSLFIKKMNKIFHYLRNSKLDNNCTPLLFNKTILIKEYYFFLRKTSFDCRERGLNNFCFKQILFLKFKKFEFGAQNSNLKTKFQESLR